ncbi:hypothetical protein HYW75_00420 [Candidatus Pacearchaeota archaeon]|nr:hypothetical protein [Candidatus Pacearchaeota archaeon]
MKYLDFWNFSDLLGLMSGAVIVGIGAAIYDAYIVPTKKMPAVSIVQEGYVIPSKLEIKLQDLDGNGEKEVIMNYQGKNYLLILDSQGKPKVQDYRVKPTEIVPEHE